MIAFLNMHLDLAPYLLRLDSKSCFAESIQYVQPFFYGLIKKEKSGRLYFNLSHNDNGINQSKLIGCLIVLVKNCV